MKIKQHLLLIYIFFYAIASIAQSPKLYKSSLKSEYFLSDRKGNIIIIGEEENIIYSLRKVDLSGKILWKVRLYGCSSTKDIEPGGERYDIKIDSADNICILLLLGIDKPEKKGYYNSSYMLSKFDTNGKKIFSFNFNVPNTDNRRTINMEIDNYGNSYLIGKYREKKSLKELDRDWVNKFFDNLFKNEYYYLEKFYFKKYNKEGALVWDKSDDPDFTNVISTGFSFAQNRLIVLEELNSRSDSGATSIVQYDTSGNPLKYTNSPYHFSRMSFDSKFNIYLMGDGYNNEKGQFLSIFNSEGKNIWSKNISNDDHFEYRSFVVAGVQHFFIITEDLDLKSRRLRKIIKVVEYDKEGNYVRTKLIHLKRSYFDNFMISFYNSNSIILGGTLVFHNYEKGNQGSYSVMTIEDFFKFKFKEKSFKIAEHL